MANIEIVEKTLACIEAGDFGVLENLLSPDFTVSGSNFEPYSKPTFLQIQQAIFAGIKDWRFNARDIYEDGDKVFVTVNISGTHTNILDLSFLGVAPIQPTGKSFQNAEEYLDFTVREGKVYAIEVTQTRGGIITLLQSLIPSPKK
jgi:predicted ester cyclase